MHRELDNKTLIEPLTMPLKGSCTVPGDKSISHRGVLLAAMAQGTSRLSNVLDSEDVRSSLAAAQKLGAKVMIEKQVDGSLSGGITGWGAQGPHEPSEPLDCGNSGTTARLLLGILAPWDIQVEIRGDASLSKRPMRRITVPLMKMGVHFKPDGRETLPLIERGTRALLPLKYTTPVASAQLKTALLLAGLYAKGVTTITEPSQSRNHTELMLPEFGIATTAAQGTASLRGPCVPQSCEINVPGDPSSAAFLVAAALLKPGSAVQVENVSLNTARIGFTRTLERMGADISVFHTGSAGKEPVGIISVRYTQDMHGCEIPAEKIPTLIDEVPLLALIAAQARGLTVFREVGELRVKETDRLEAVVQGLSRLGAEAWISGNDLFIEGQTSFKVPDNLELPSQGDHRLAMTWALVGLTGQKALKVRGFDAVAVSYPSFLEDIERLTR